LEPREAVATGGLGHARVEVAEVEPTEAVGLVDRATQVVVGRALGEVDERAAHRGDRRRGE